MRRAIPGVLFSLFLVACGGGPTPEQEATRQALVNAGVVRAAVIHLSSKYEESLLAAGADLGGDSMDWQAAAAYRETPEGRVATQFLSGFTNPMPVDAAFKRAAEIGELAKLTSELASLALQPRGSWAAFIGETYDLRARIDQALETLQKGTKAHVLIAARQETNIKTSAYTDSLTRARTQGEAPKAPEGAGKTP